MPLLYVKGSIKDMAHSDTVKTPREIRLNLARKPWRSVDFRFVYIILNMFLYIYIYIVIDFAGLEGLVIYWAVLLTGF